MPDRPAKQTEGLLLSTDDDAMCRSCFAPAIFYDPARGTHVCLGCAIAPVPVYGPGYTWTGESRSQNCNELSPYGGWYCSVTPGHDRLHEAWGGYPQPLMAWTLDNRAVYERDLGGWLTDDPPPWQGHPYTMAERDAGWCNQRRIARYEGSRITALCTLRRGHTGWHEAWRSATGHHERTEPMLAWTDGFAWQPASGRTGR